MTDIDSYARRILSDWSWAGDEGTFGNRLESSASSPESFESSCSSPDARSGTMGTCQTYVMSGRKLKPKVKMSTKRRMKASEREKLRMRSLAEALHQLRDYLPPVYSRRGQPLTKIQTLKYTIQYIKELSNVLEQCHVTDSDSS